MRCVQSLLKRFKICEINCMVSFVAVLVGAVESCAETLAGSRADSLINQHTSAISTKTGLYNLQD